VLQPDTGPAAKRRMGGGSLHLPAAADAHRRLVAAVVALVDAGRPPPCTVHPDAWTGDRADTRAGAAHACRPCPALDGCHDYAATARETWNVWAGRDRTCAPSTAPTPTRGDLP
jgi:hypothetical protein